MEAPKTQKILGQEATLFRDGEHPIYLLTDGRFAVEWGGLWKVKQNVKSLEKIVVGLRKSVKLFRVGNNITFNSRPTEVLDVSEMHENRVIDAKGKRHFSSWRNWYLFDEDTVAKLNDLNRRITEAEKAFNEEFSTIIENAQTVYSDTFQNYLPK